MINAESRKMKQAMIVKAEGKFAGLPRAKRKAFAKMVVDQYVGKIREEMKRGVIYIEGAR